MNKKAICDCSLKILKVDACNPSIVLQGAVFELYFYNSAERRYILLKTLSTDKEGTSAACSLKPGKYKLLEIQAPEGYYIPLNNATCVDIGSCGVCLQDPEVIIIKNRKKRNCQYSCKKNCQKIYCPYCKCCHIHYSHR